MFLPSLSIQQTSREMTGAFGGLDHRPVAADGAFAGMKNLTSDAYPLLSVRPRRAKLRTLTKPNGLWAHEKLCWVDGTALYYDGEQVGTVADSPKTFVNLGADILIWPDKARYNTHTGEFSRLEATATTTGTVTATMCSRLGEPYTGLVVSSSPPDNPANGAKWLDTSTDPNVLRTYSELTGVWAAVPTVYVKIEADGIGEEFKELDAVTISGMTDDSLNGSFVLYGAGEDYVIVTGIQLGRLQDAGSFLGTNLLSSFFLSNFDKIANRFIYWLDPEKDALGLGYQLLKARESILLGGWFGTSSVTDLPVKTSDLVYPALIQRCGMVFAILVFFIFILMWLEGIRLFIRKADRYHQAVGAGFVFMLFDQTLIIIAGSTGLCPLTGITLPFISSGGSSLFVTFVMVGVMIAISSNVKWKGMTDDEEEFFKENAVIAKCHAYLRHLNDHIPHPDLRAAAGRLRGGRPTEAGSKGKHVSKGVRPGKNFGQRGKHSRRVRKTAGKKNVQ